VRRSTGCWPVSDHRHRGGWGSLAGGAALVSPIRVLASRLLVGICWTALPPVASIVWDQGLDGGMARLLVISAHN